MLYMKPEIAPAGEAAPDPGAGLAAAVAAAASLLLGLWPSGFLGWVVASLPAG